MKKIVMTGGGTAGHVTPNIAIINELKDKYEIHYIGSRNSIEEQLITEQGIKFHAISSGKFRRSLDYRNFTDIFRVLKGLQESKHILKKLKPDLIFSKGGYVTVPVILASRSTNTPVIIHESDLSVGLANKISIPIAKKVCVTFSKTKELLGEKAILTGPPVRTEMLSGSGHNGAFFCNFKQDKPIILFIGGSQGSQKINNLVRKNIEELQDFNLIHICGEGNLDESVNFENYKQFEYIKKELPDVFSYADLIVSRAGSNTIYEILALRKPNLLIPLSKKASRGDQIQNADEFELKGYSRVLQDDDDTGEFFVTAIKGTYRDRDEFIRCMERSHFSNGTLKIIEVIEEELSL